MYRPKWWKSEIDLKEEDVVLFRKHDSDVASPWILGTVEQLKTGRDGISRRAIIRHKNASEDFFRQTDRHIRNLAKIWSLEDQNLDEDLALIYKKIEESHDGERLVNTLLDRSQMDAARNQVTSNHARCHSLCSRSLMLSSEASSNDDEACTEAFEEELRYPLQDLELPKDFGIDAMVFDEDFEEASEPVSSSCSFSEILGSLEPHRY